jgi:hypothetical protein
LFERVATRSLVASFTPKHVRRKPQYSLYPTLGRIQCIFCTNHMYLDTVRKLGDLSHITLVATSASIAATRKIAFHFRHSPRIYLQRTKNLNMLVCLAPRRHSESSRPLQECLVQALQGYFYSIQGSQMPLLLCSLRAPRCCRLIVTWNCSSHTPVGNLN